MPNTLAHIGLQSLATRAILPGAEIKWMWTACVLPDLPWICQRLVKAAFPDVSVYDIRLWAVIQSSLFMTLFLALAIAVVACRPARSFAILAVGVVLHLLMDAFQTKWANGVVLFAPWSWDVKNFALFWPGSLPTYVLTGLGAVYALHAFLSAKNCDAQTPRRPRGLLRWTACGGLILAYLALPLHFKTAAWEADPHFIQTLAMIEDRPGKLIEIDRNVVLRTAEGRQVLVAWTGETFILDRQMPPEARVISLKGYFTDVNEIAVKDVRIHTPHLRSLFTYAGLLIVLLWWLRFEFRHHARKW